ncbi:hypothetical protein A2U01_0085095, partial [Trifolium medium]|nr:hypothetical protein [Trifolium medium]
PNVSVTTVPSEQTEGRRYEILVTLLCSREGRQLLICCFSPDSVTST